MKREIITNDQGKAKWRECEVSIPETVQEWIELGGTEKALVAHAVRNAKVAFRGKKEGTEAAWIKVLAGITEKSGGRNTEERQAILTAIEAVKPELVEILRNAKISTLRDTAKVLGIEIEKGDS